jgi:hypothetical protein
MDTIKTTIAPNRMADDFVLAAKRETGGNYSEIGAFRMDAIPSGWSAIGNGHESVLEYLKGQAVDLALLTGNVPLTLEFTTEGVFVCAWAAQTSTANASTV